MMALHAESTKYLYLGGLKIQIKKVIFLNSQGILSSAVLCLLVTLLIAPWTPFMRSAVLWGGLAINIGFVVYDTQLIAERRRRGDADYIWHTVFI